MRFDITNAPPGARLYFTILFSVTTRSAFDAAFVAGTLSNNVLGFFSVPLEDIPIDDNGARALTVGLQAPPKKPTASTCVSPACTRSRSSSATRRTPSSPTPS